MPSDAFDRSIEALRGAIRLHCYRMLGSAADSDDFAQETMLRAWKSRATLDDPARLRPWLYRIATNVCLDELEKRPRRLLACDACPPTASARPPFSMVEEPVWLEPMPNAWLEAAEPDARYTQKESVALAFCAAIQLLTPLQRASLLLRDVVGLSAEETAEALAIGVGAANSALFRARTALETRLGAEPQPHAGDVDRELLGRYVRAFEDANLDAIVALFHEDVRTTMPPVATWVSGRAANEAFYRMMFRDLAPGHFRHLFIGANGQPALAVYRPRAPSGPLVLKAIQLVGTRARKLHSIDHFMLPHLRRVFDVPTIFPG